jgi:hypothetical protein
VPLHSKGYNNTTAFFWPRRHASHHEKTTPQKNVGLTHRNSGTRGRKFSFFFAMLPKRVRLFTVAKLFRNGTLFRTSLFN